MKRIGELLCRLGWHGPREPVTMHPGRENGLYWTSAYVLLRCTRCGHDDALIGDEADRWIDRYVAG